MSKRPEGLAYVGTFTSYLLYLPVPFPRDLGIDLEGSSTFLLSMLSIHINRLGLFSHLYENLLNCISMCMGSWVGATAFCMEIKWCSTIAVSAWCSAYQLPGCECAVKPLYIPLGCI